MGFSVQQVKVALATTGVQSALGMLLTNEAGGSNIEHNRDNTTEMTTNLHPVAEGHPADIGLFPLTTMPSPAPQLSPPPAEISLLLPVHRPKTETPTSKTRPINSLRKRVRSGSACLITPTHFGKRRR